MNAVSLLLDYAVRLAPGFALFAACLVLVPMRATGARIALYIGLFVLVRDAMTPAGLWRIGEGMRLGFHPDPAVLAALGLVSLAGVAFLLAVERDLRPLVVWWRASRPAGVAAGLATGAVLALPLQALWGFPLAQFGAGPGFLAGLALLAYLGNLLEEVLFRGYFQSWLTGRVTPLRAALLGGLVFAACHSFLAVTVTDAGWPVLAFTLAEGVACGLVALRHGVASAAIAHGTAILLVAAPMA